MHDLDCRRCDRWKGLNKLPLIVKHGFQFLNTLPHRWNQERMFLRRQGYEIARAVIVLDAVKVVNEPPFRDWLPMSLLPHKSVFHNVCPLGGFLASANQDIAFLRSPSTFPSLVVFSQLELTKAILTVA